MVIRFRQACLESMADQFASAWRQMALRGWREARSLSGSLDLAARMQLV